jgi:hypothetical protein
MTIEAPARAFLQPAAKKDVTVIQAEMVSTTLPKAVSLDDNGAKRDHSIYKIRMVIIYMLSVLPARLGLKNLPSILERVRLLQLWSIIRSAPRFWTG